MCFSDLASDRQKRDDVGNGHEVNDAADTAGVPHGFSVLAMCVAGCKVTDEAQTDVVEAAEESMLEFTHVAGDDCEELVSEDRYKLVSLSSSL